jgi:hypothetical protein
MNTHDVMMPFGKYAGQRVTRVPVSYLKWAVANEVEARVETKEGTFPFFEVARSEIERRGERLENIDVSMHAIDRASLYFMPKFRLEHGHMEGLASWVARLSWEAWQHRETHGKKGDDGVWKIEHNGIKFIVEEMLIPVVKTVES